MGTWRHLDMFQICKMSDWTKEITLTPEGLIPCGNLANNDKAKSATHWMSCWSDCNALGSMVNSFASTCKRTLSTSSIWDSVTTKWQKGGKKKQNRKLFPDFEKNYSTHQYTQLIATKITRKAYQPNFQQVPFHDLIDQRDATMTWKLLQQTAASSMRSNLLLLTDNWRKAYKRDLIQ